MGTATRTRRPSTAAVGWFVFMVASWVAFAVLAATAGDVLADVWQWVRDLPLVLELVVWFLTLPWMLALAIWESDWSDTARVLVVLGIAGAWTRLSIPRAQP